MVVEGYREVERGWEGGEGPVSVQDEEEEAAVAFMKAANPHPRVSYLIVLLATTTTCQSLRFFNRESIWV